MHRSTMLIVAGLLFAGCAGTKTQVPSSPPESDSDIPDFVLNPPKEVGFLFGTGIAEQQSVQLAKETSDLRARKEIATVLSRRISSMMKDYLGQAGLGSDTEVTELVQWVTHAISNIDMVGATIEKREYIQGKMYSLAKYPLDDAARKLIRDAVTKSLSSEQAFLSRFRAKQGFEELDKELDKINAEGEQ